MGIVEQDAIKDISMSVGYSLGEKMNHAKALKITLASEDTSIGMKGLKSMVKHRTA